MYNQPRKNDSNIWVVIFFVILLAPFIFFVPSSNKEVREVDKKRKLSNIIGLFVLFTIIIGAFGTRLVYRALDKKHEQMTSEILSKTAQSFAHHESEVIMNWAKGEIRDLWGNTLVLVSNDESGVIMVSKGKDGKFGTGDDLQYSVAWTPKIVPQSPLLPEPKKTFGQKIRGFFIGD